MKEHVVEYKSTQGTTMFFEVWEYSRPHVRARFAVPVPELARDPDKAGMLMDVRAKTALEQVRSR